MNTIQLAPLIGTIDFLLITFDSLRWDVLTQAHMPELNAFVPKWEARHSPASFTYAAHHAFFSGFLPTPILPPKPEARLFAARFAGAKSVDKNTFLFDEATLPEALKNRNYHTICIGGVGFFNQQNALSQVLPNLFESAYWSPAMGVTHRHSTQAQVNKAIEVLEKIPHTQSTFLFMNVSATHHPTHIFHPTLDHDSVDTQISALEYAQKHIAQLLAYQQRRKRTLVMLTSDHGDAFGEDGFHGHRIGHSSVWTVPYSAFILEHTCS